MLPAWNVPLGIRTILQAKDQGITDFLIVLSATDAVIWRDWIVDTLHQINVSAEIVVQHSPNGPAAAISVAMEKVDTGQVTIFLADTLILDPLIFEGDWIAVAKKEPSAEWCWAEVDDQQFIRTFHDKISPPNHSCFAVCGIYQFSSTSTLKAACQKVCADNILVQGELQISSLLTEYIQSISFKAIPVLEWLDFGNTENFQSATKKLAQSNKECNAIRLDPKGYIVKTARGEHTLKPEIEWYSTLNEHSFLAPEIFNVRSDGKEYCVEYMDHPSLYYIYQYYNLPQPQIFRLFESTVDFLQDNLWSKEIPTPSVADMSAATQFMYIEKTKERLEAWLRQNPSWNTQSDIVINGRKHPSLNKILASLYPKLSQACQGAIFRFIHGDTNFSNIFYSRAVGNFKLIDPRGNFGTLSSTQGGDLQYEFAKLRHSYNGAYENFSCGLYNLTIFSQKDFSLQVPRKEKELISEMDDLSSEFVDIENVKSLEVALFLSMIPLHANQGGRDIALLLRAYQLAGEITQ